MKAFVFSLMIALWLASPVQAHDDRGAEIVLRGMEIIAGAIAARRERHYHYHDHYDYYPRYRRAPRYYDPYGTYYYEGGLRHYRGNKYYRERY